MVKKFLRRTWNRYTKLGKGRKKKQRWRKPKGRDNKMREKRKGYAPVVKIGYKKNEKMRNKIEAKKPMLISNLKELEKVGKDNVIILGKVGKKKKMEILKKAKEQKIPVYKINAEKFLKKSEKKKEKEPKKEEPKNKEKTKESKK